MSVRPQYVCLYVCLSGQLTLLIPPQRAGLKLIKLQQPKVDKRHTKLSRKATSKGSGMASCLMFFKFYLFIYYYFYYLGAVKKLLL